MRREHISREELIKKLSRVIRATSIAARGRAGFVGILCLVAAKR